MLFQNRQEAAEKLAAELQKFKDIQDTVILALPRGGVPVGKMIAEELNLPLDIIITKKIGAPGNPEFAIGAVTEKGSVLFNEDAVGHFSYSGDVIGKVKEEAIAKVEKYREGFRKGGKMVDVKDKTVILVDDGIATGMTVFAAIKDLREQGCKKIVVAVPVAPPDTTIKLKEKADEVVVLHTPVGFMAVGQFYQDFEQVNDEEVKEMLSSQHLP